MNHVSADKDVNDTVYNNNREFTFTLCLQPIKNKQKQIVYAALVKKVFLTIN